MNFNFAQIDAIINARSIALVGATSKPLKFGSLFAAAQRDFGFSGTIYLINPSETAIMGQQAYPDLKSLPEIPDLVCLTIPAYQCMEVLQDCADSGIKGVIIMASGFREIGDEGKALEDEALRLAHKGGFRILGPNCFGIYNPRNRLTILPGTSFSTKPGKVAFISQSGGFSAHIGRLGKDLGINFSAIISYGNAADLDECDFLRYFAHDPQTEIIVSYLEGVKDGRAFFNALKEASSAKQVVMWKVGKSDVSRRAVASHTGSMAGTSLIFEALLRQCGVIAASGVDEVGDVLLALQHLGRNPGKRLLLSGGGGGLGTYAADIAEEEGLAVPCLNKNRQGQLQEILSQAGAVAGNPLDIGAPLIPLPIFEAVMQAAAKDRATDILVFDLALNFAHSLGGEDGLNQAADIFIKACRENGKPAVITMYSRAVGLEDLALEGVLRRQQKKFLENGIPVYPSMPRALRALSLVN